VDGETRAFLEGLRVEREDPSLAPAQLRSSSCPEFEELLADLPDDPLEAWSRAYGLLLPDVLRLLQAAIAHAVADPDVKKLKLALDAVQVASDRVLGRAAQRVEVEERGVVVHVPASREELVELIARKRGRVLELEEGV
jgi:hypothetical protein